MKTYTVQDVSVNSDGARELQRDGTLAGRGFSEEPLIFTDIVRAKQAAGAIAATGDWSPVEVGFDC